MHLITNWLLQSVKLSGEGASIHYIDYFYYIYELDSTRAPPTTFDDQFDFS